VTFTANCCVVVIVAGRMGGTKKMVEFVLGTSANGCCALYASPTGSVQLKRRLAELDRTAVTLPVALPAGGFSTSALVS
jgi:hypothetical protein